MEWRFNYISSAINGKKYLYTKVWNVHCFAHIKPTSYTPSMTT